MQYFPSNFRVIDSHTGGEPTRLIVSGGPDLGRGSMAERRDILGSRFDFYRTSLCNEPRGSDVMVGGIICEPEVSTSACGIIFFNNVGYLNMCGHGTIGLVETLSFLNRIESGSISIETPVGMVMATRHEDGRVGIKNVAARRYRKDVIIDVDGYGKVKGDIAWGGNWFFLISEHDHVVDLSRAEPLLAFTKAVMAALDAGGVRGDDGLVIDHVEVFAPPSNVSRADSKNFVLCPGGAYDRSPCGTGTSAKLACLAADGKLAPGQVWKQESIVGSVFEASYQLESGQIIPTIIGRAHVTADLNVVIDPSDPFRFGIPVSKHG